MKYLRFYLFGLSIIFFAAVLNLIANYFGITTWYDFLKNVREVDFISVIWLFAVYPLLLAYFSVKFYQYLIKDKNE